MNNSTNDKVAILGDKMDVFKKKTNMNDIIKYEPAMGRTYGECIMDEISSIQMFNGKFTPTLLITNKPNPMPKEKALTYYTNKLRSVWLNN